jgi:hypothetical protein
MLHFKLCAIVFLNFAFATYAKTSCLQNPIFTALIFQGHEIDKGEFPWIAVLSVKSTGDYFCGGVLVSQNKVLTGLFAIISINVINYTLK